MHCYFGNLTLPSPSLLSFSVCAFLQQFKAQKGRPRGDLPALIAELGLEPGVLNQPWVELSVRALSSNGFSGCTSAFAAVSPLDGKAATQVEGGQGDPSMLHFTAPVRTWQGGWACLQGACDAGHLAAHLWVSALPGGGWCRAGRRSG